MFCILSNSVLKYYSGDFIGLCYDHAKVKEIRAGEIWDMLCPDCNHKDCGNKNENFSIEKDISYIFNNEVFRCDDLDKNFAKDNFLFSGCSVTFGMGIPYEKTWPYQLNKMLGGDKLFNIGLPAGSFKSIIFDVFAYLRKYGKPKGIFILFPPLLRQPVIKNDKLSTLPYYRTDHPGSDAALKILNNETMLFEFSRLIGILDDYLYELNVPFVWGTYEPGLDKILRGIDISKNYVSVVENQKAFEYANSIPEDERTKYWLKSRDGHPPVFEQSVFAKAFLDKYNS